MSCYVLCQNATDTFAFARRSLDANSSANEAAANFDTVQQLRQQVWDIDERARNTTQIELLRSEFTDWHVCYKMSGTDLTMSCFCFTVGLLGEYIQLRTNLEGQQTVLNALETEMDDLLARVETQCNTGSC